METIIDLSNFRTPGSKVFTGRDRGIVVRNNSKIDELITNSNQIEILVPEDIRSINPSFLEEFLINVVQKLGKANFYKNVFFRTSGKYDIEEDLQEAVDSILREENGLSK
ncbi:DUF4325 domain-containing protein [Flavobacterium sp. ENC]|uniref:DUF4325 domain-containing protein n=1 Tax=Flavobacterium sp. ENC TaxID=2897330 RepID=UPI001E55EFF2|nr:DUF4325 domain-containing protein [Flavobacterium sp. ENC]MCD0465974.1 DUF4325 domain-containing protein [Flavobacterium sp. ENC]